MVKYIESRIPRAGVSMPKESSAQLAFKSSPEQTGIKTNILSARDNLGSSIVKIEEWKISPGARGKCLRCRVNMPFLT
jgi:hypothetical protein